jgi:16S rRNA (guanine527-N7)-methyltransferase
MAQPLPEAQQALLLNYLSLLDKWNRVFNLTAVRDPAIMVRRQLLDSLSILPWVDQGPVLDVGSGAGLPGIPLAIARPELTFSLLDTNGKKARFLQQAAAELGLANVEILKARVEALERPRQYARITSRAFATLADMVAGSRQLLAADGCWLAMKGAAPESEIGDLPVDTDAVIETLKVPGESGARHLAVIRDRRR